MLAPFFMHFWGGREFLYTQSLCFVPSRFVELAVDLTFLKPESERWIVRLGLLI